MLILFLIGKGLCWCALNLLAIFQHRIAKKNQQGTLSKGNSNLQ